MEFKEKIALVTGAADGIGLAIVRALLNEGAEVYACDINYPKLEQNSPEGNVHCLSLDVSNADQWNEVLKKIEIDHGKLDILVNDAGVVSKETPEEISLDEWQRVMDTNAKGCYLGMKLSLPLLRVSGQGAIVNISSLCALSGTGGGMAYHASKGAIRALSMRAATHFGEYGIRVNTIFPGWIETAMTYGARPAKAAHYANRQCIKRSGLPEDIANACLFLCSSEAGFITGAELVVDGGYSLT